MEVCTQVFFFENLKIVVKNPEKLNCSYSKVSHYFNKINKNTPDFQFDKFQFGKNVLSILFLSKPNFLLYVQNKYFQTYVQKKSGRLPYPQIYFKFVKSFKNIMY